MPYFQKPQIQSRPASSRACVLNIIGFRVQGLGLRGFRFRLQGFGLGFPTHAAVRFRASWGPHNVIPFAVRSVFSSRFFTRISKSYYIPGSRSTIGTVLFVRVVPAGYYKDLKEPKR